MKVREKTKGSGEWWIFIDHQGKREAKKIGRDKRLAEEAAKKIEARLVLGDMNLSLADDEGIPTFKQYAESWITIVVPATCENTTLRDY